MNILRLLSYLTIVVSGVLVYTLVLAEGYVVSGATAAKCILLSILAIVPCIYGVKLFRSTGEQAPKIKKITNVLTLVAGLIVLGNVIYWQWFNFWSL